MSRDIVLRATLADLFGDETYELWLKHLTDEWVLDQTGDVIVDEATQQEYLLSTLIEGDTYVAQLRLTRAARYRAGYLTADPDTWPSGSRVTFVPGALEGVGAPTILSGVWARTSGVSTTITLSINADDLDKDIKLYRDGVYQQTIVAPHVNPISVIDNNPTNGEHIYTAKHTVGFLDGPASTPFDVFAGPPVPASIVRTSDDDSYGKYILTWDADGEAVRLQDDYLCDDTFADRLFGGTVLTSGATGQIADTESPPGAVQSIFFQARVRREVTTFGVTDVSDWAYVNITMDTDDPDPDFNSCP